MKTNRDKIEAYLTEQLILEIKYPKTDSLSTMLGRGVVAGAKKGISPLLPGNKTIKAIEDYKKRRHSAGYYDHDDFINKNMPVLHKYSPELADAVHEYGRNTYPIAQQAVILSNDKESMKEKHDNSEELASHHKNAMDAIKGKKLPGYISYLYKNLLDAHTLRNRAQAFNNTDFKSSVVDDTTTRKANLDRRINKLRAITSQADSLGDPTTSGKMKNKLLGMKQDVLYKFKKETIPKKISELTKKHHDEVHNNFMNFIKTKTGADPDVHSEFAKQHKAFVNSGDTRMSPEITQHLKNLLGKHVGSASNEMVNHFVKNSEGLVQANKTHNKIPETVDTTTPKYNTKGQYATRGGKPIPKIEDPKGVSALEILGKNPPKQIEPPKDRPKLDPETFVIPGARMKPKRVK